jgi:hypothetical protein
MESPNKKRKDVLLKLWAMTNNASFISGFEPQKLEEFLEKLTKPTLMLSIQ